MLEAGAVPSVGVLVAVLLCVGVADAWAQTSPETQAFPSTESPKSTLPEVTSPQSNVITLPTIRVRATKPKTTAGREETTQTGEQSVQAPASSYDSGTPNVAGGASVQLNAASQLTVSGAQVNAVPLSRPGEALEIVPGLIVTQHSGEGKANQYFLRGYNLDHGTDLAITYDDVPINMPTHAHGQGYADLNMLIPELIGSMNIRKGPYYADVGDFGSVGAVSISLRDSRSQKRRSGYVPVASVMNVSSAMAQRQLAQAICSMPLRLRPTTGRGPDRTTCESSMGFLRYSQGIRSQRANR